MFIDILERNLANNSFWKEMDRFHEEPVPRDNRCGGLPCYRSELLPCVPCQVPVAHGTRRVRPPAADTAHHLHNTVCRLRLFQDL